MPLSKYSDTCKHTYIYTCKVHTKEHTSYDPKTVDNSNSPELMNHFQRNTKKKLEDQVGENVLNTEMESTNITCSNNLTHTKWKIKLNQRCWILKQNQINRHHTHRKRTDTCMTIRTWGNYHSLPWVSRSNIVFLGLKNYFSICRIEELFQLM